MDNYVNEETKEKMEKVAHKLFTLYHGFSYFQDSIDVEVCRENALGISSYARLIREYIIGIKEKYTEILEILDVTH